LPNKEFGIHYMSELADYPIIDIPQDAREDTEQLGSKPKFWVTREDGRWLFKEARLNTGEDWAEKVAAELAKLLRIDSAEVELATYAGQRGCISKNFIRRGSGDALVHGNELMGTSIGGYDKNKVNKQSDHNIENIIAAIFKFAPDTVAREMLMQLAEYMVLDALIGNTDRHHENWGFRLTLGRADNEFPFSVAPSYDHASSLGREYLDERCAKILHENGVGKYVRKGHGGVYWQSTDKRGVSPLKLVELVFEKYPEYFAPALRKMRTLSEDNAWQVVSRVPANLASDVSKQLAHSIICYSLNELKRIQT
jgi:HipA-like C-terminal domain